ncbi:MAG: STAS domain-containing protein [Solirubrobacterales bacterium]
MPSSADTEVRDGLLIVHQLADGERIRLALRGELDLANAKTLEASMLEAFDSGREVVVDLGKLEFLDSTGISLLVAAMGRPDAGRLSFLPSESGEVTRLLALTGLDARMRFGRSSQSPGLAA